MSRSASKFVVEYCSCGGAFKVAAHTPEDRALAEELFDRWSAAHVGPGHWSTTAHESNMARNCWTTRPAAHSQEHAS